MPPVRQEFNVKGRQSTGGKRKKGKFKKRKPEGKFEEDDPNAEMIVAENTKDKEQGRREQLKEELRAQTDNWSSKKKKRLEKYIDKKLKKEERVLIFEKLAKSQHGVDSSLLQSSSTLGTGKAVTHQERMEKDEDLEIKQILRGRNGKRKRGISGIVDVMNGDSDSESDDKGLSDPDTDLDELQSIPTKPSVKAAEVDKPQNNNVRPFVEALAVVGSALRRNEDGTVATPIVRIRSKKGGLGRWKTSHRSTAEHDLTDTSFDSSDSAYDSLSDNEENTERTMEENQDSVDEHEEDKSVDRHRASNVEGELDEDDGLDFQESDRDQPKEQPQKKSSFKEWATKQLSIAKGYVTSPINSPEGAPTPVSMIERPTKRRKMNDANRMHGPLGEEYPLPQSTFSQHVLQKANPQTGTKAYVKSTPVKRPSDVQEARLMLPVVTEEQPIMEAIMLNPVVIICGETGSGKTTQVPQFLYEAGFGNSDSDNPGMIGITQPRRVAAISMAQRIGYELSLTSSQVSYQIRYDATVSSSTSIKFMTDGVLLRELATDFLLSKYSVIIIDEAHERSINTDILIGVLSRVIKLREGMWKEGKEGMKPLRLVIMSATLRVSDFAENKSLFSVPPPIIDIAVRQYPVTVHFSRRTSPDYIAEAIKKTSRIHTRLPPGGILIFLTGQNEITGVCRRLEERYGRKTLKRKQGNRPNRIFIKETKLGQSDQRIQSLKVNPTQADVEAEDIDNDVEDLAFAPMDESFDGDAADDYKDDLESEDDEGLDNELGIDTEVPMHIVPLYSLLPSEKQMDAFKPPPPDARLVVVATNVAETSVTIPGIKYVIDCGRMKERRYDVVNGIHAFQITWISKASAAQRAGRAGRTGPGHCYRLYSSALYEHYFQQFNSPEILRVPVEGIVLQMKNMHIDAVVNFPFPTPPDRFALHQAEKVLTHLGALKKSAALTSQLGAVGAQITDLGRTMALFPLSPRYSRMLAAGQQHQCLPYVIAIVSAVSVGDPFVHEEAVQAEDDGHSSSEGEESVRLSGGQTIAKEAKRSQRKAYFQIQQKHASLGDFTSDTLKILSVVGAYEYHGGGIGFCSDHFVRLKAMEEIHKLRAQVSNIVQTYFPATNIQFTSKLPPPNQTQIKALKQLICAAFIDQVAVRKDLARQHDPSSGLQYSNSHNVPYRAVGITEDIFLHPSSVLWNLPPPNFIVFQEVVRTTRVFVKGLTAVNPAWLSSLSKDTPLCTYSKPFKGVDGVLMVTPRYGPEGWELPAVKAEGHLQS